MQGLSESLLPMVATVPVRGDERSSRHKTCKFAPVPEGSNVKSLGNCGDLGP